MTSTERTAALRSASEVLNLSLTEEQIQRLVAGEEIELTDGAFEAAECCPDGWIGIGHKPRFCIKPFPPPPKVQICWG